MSLRPERSRRQTQAWERGSQGERGLLLGRLALRARIVGPRPLADAVALQGRVRAIGGTAPPLGDVMRDLGLMNAEQVETLLRQQAEGEVPADDRVGALAVLNGLTTAMRVSQAVERQAASGRRGEPVLRLGEILVAQGDLVPQAVRALLCCQGRLRGVAPASASDESAVEVVPGGYRVGGEMLLLEDAPADLRVTEGAPVWLLIGLAVAVGALAMALAWALASG